VALLLPFSGMRKYSLVPVTKSLFVAGSR